MNKCRWVKTPVPGTSIAKLSSDVNSWKTFLMNRLVCPVGGIGAIQLFKSHPAEHELFSQHIAKSEYPLPVTARNKTIIEWKELSQGGWPDNDYLDTTAGCMCLASLCGCRIPDDVDVVVAKKTDAKDAVQKIASVAKKSDNIVVSDSAMKASTAYKRGTQTAGKATPHHRHQRKRRSMAAAAEAKRLERQKGKLGSSNLSR